MIANSPGGLGGFLDRLKSAGLTSEVASWLGHADAAPIAAAQVERALGATALGGIAARLGLAQGVVSTALGYALPKIVGLLTPGGVVPSGVPAEVTGFLSQPRAAAATEPVAPRRLDVYPASAQNQFQRPALAMAGARCAGRRWPAFLFLVDAQPDAVRSARRKGAGAGDARALDRRASAVPAARSFASGASAIPAACSCAGGASAVTAAFGADGRQTPAPAPSTEAQTTAAPPAPARPRKHKRQLRRLRLRPRRKRPPPRLRLRRPDRRLQPQLLPQSQRPNQPRPRPRATPTRFALSNDNGVVRASGSVRDEDAKTSIVNALNAVFGADKVKSAISIDQSAAAAPWLGNFRAALEALKGANVDAIFEGDKVNVGGGAMEDAARDKIIAALKSALGASVAVGALTDKTAAAVAIANNRATTELASLQSGFAVKDLLFALNDSVVNFPSASAEVPESMAPFLKTAAADLKQLKAGHVLEIAGYTDNTGDAALNLALSQRRAEAVREALIEYGAAPDMLVAKGYGEADPIASNDTAEGRLKNRRIEYHVVKAPT